MFSSVPPPIMHPLKDDVLKSEAVFKYVFSK
jgi:hypothetical protein